MNKIYGSEKDEMRPAIDAFIAQLRHWNKKSKIRNKSTEKKNYININRFVIFF